MELDRIFTFLVYAECKSSLIAAKRLKITQPSVLQRIKALEESTQVQLFRTGRNKVLTDEGQALYSALKPLFEKTVNQVDSAFSQLRHKSPIIRVGGRRELIKFLILGRLKSYSAAKIFATFYSEVDCLRALEKGEIDVALLRSPPSSHDLYSQRAITSENTLWVSKTALKKAKCEPTLRSFLTKIQDFPNVAYRHPDPILLEFVREYGPPEKAIDTRFTADDWEIVLAMTDELNGYSVVPSNAAPARAQLDQLVQLPIRNSNARQFFWVYSKELRNQPYIREFFAQIEMRARG